MPVKIATPDGTSGSNPMVITLEEFENAVANFSLHYFYGTDMAEFGGKDLSISWDELQNLVTEFAEDNDLSEEDISIRFILCFDSNEGNLYLRMRFSEMRLTDITEQAHRVYELPQTPEAWYEIRQDLITPCDEPAEQDNEYLNDFYYCPEEHCTADEMEQLSQYPEKFVHCLSFPWYQELKAMYENNGSPDNAKLHLASASSTTERIMRLTNVLWPHGLILYLENGDGDTLLNDESYLLPFENKGANFATTCPPNCNSYITINQDPL